MTGTRSGGDRHSVRTPPLAAPVCALPAGSSCSRSRPGIASAVSSDPVPARGRTLLSPSSRCRPRRLEPDRADFPAQRPNGMSRLGRDMRSIHAPGGCHPSMQIAPRAEPAPGIGPIGEPFVGEEGPVEDSINSSYREQNCFRWRPLVRSAKIRFSGNSVDGDGRIDSRPQPAPVPGAVASSVAFHDREHADSVVRKPSGNRSSRPVALVETEEKL